MEDVAKNKALIRWVYEEGFSNNDLGVMDVAFGESYICRFPALEPIVGLEACKRAIGAFLRAFPATYRIEHLVGEGDRVVARWNAQGVHAGDFQDMLDPGRIYPATHLPVRFSATDIYRFEGGKIVEEWNSLEEFGLLAQIGGLVRPG
ncbi:ester cyclase [Roseococcus microcysteis]|uniref:ester cyclase n=1 Tax=Roseococcus microcysteis TaxID=2771361 RepID=UPI00168A7EA9|nr:ester cyclase [Roseococcus microcysteis]